ncbi:hypothetical protein CHLRE_09g392951v5 [Chlamydomonas reinhardtii]|uniref:Uncharacterized protein n=1 Tax=Chlamydomonas reinhardtii TaxID=3055 RepID=A0A2K3DEB7_CHLRE|nr:uncharacterized protein CHLRE_09g392951v5 [Chlamydomonas reinhardtii]PNW78873.1 hypothetical protein CHLRE_09g392951v5 [Chlamydomonas reinhardtii]
MGGLHAGRPRPRLLLASPREAAALAQADGYTEPSYTEPKRSVSSPGCRGRRSWEVGRNTVGRWHL